MADYSLQLKANLDLSQVQQQLNQLRGQMTQFKTNVTGGNNRAQNAGVMSSNTGINYVLRSLQTSIDRLNYNIQKLVVSGQRAVVQNQNNNSFPAASLAADIVTARSFGEKLADHARKINRGGKSGGIIDIDNNNASFDPAFRRGARMFAGQYGLGMIGNALSQSDNRYVQMGGGIVNAASSGLMGAASFGMAFPKVGMGWAAGIGGAVGIGEAIAAVSQALLKGAEEIAAASEKASKTLAQGKSIIQSHVENADEMRFKTQMQNATAEQRKQMLNQLNQNRYSATNKYYDLIDNQKSVYSAINEKYLKRAGETEAGSEERIQAEQEKADAVLAYARSIEKAKKEMDKNAARQDYVQQLIDKDNAAKEQETKMTEELTKLKAREKEAREKVIASLNDQANESLTGIARNEEKNALAYQLHNIQYDEDGNPRGTSPMAQFQKASAILDNYRRLRDFQTKSAKSLNEQALASNDENEKANLLKQAQDAMSSANHAAGLAAQVENFISNLNTMPGAKPDMSNVTSLGQYGFGMGEKNDNLMRMERYYDNVENLTREIRNKLIEGIKTEGSSSYN